MDKFNMNVQKSLKLNNSSNEKVAPKISRFSKYADFNIFQHNDDISTPRSLFAPSHQQVTFILQFLDSKNDSDKPVRDALIANLQDEQLKIFFSLLVEYLELKSSYTLCHKFKNKREMLAVKQKINEFVDKLSEIDATDYCIINFVYFTYVYPHSQQALLFLTTYLRENSKLKNPLIYELYAKSVYSKYCRGDNSKNSIITQGAELGSPTCKMLLISSQIIALLSATDSIWIAACVNDLSMVMASKRLREICDSIDIKILSALRDLANLGNEKAVNYIHDFAATILKLLMYNLNTKDGIIIPSDVLTKLLAFLKILNPELERSLTQNADTIPNSKPIKDFVEKIYVNQIYPLCNNLVDQVKHDDVYDDKLYQLTCRVETLKASQTINANESIKNMLTELKRNLDVSAIIRLNYGELVISDKQLEEVESLLDLHESFIYLQVNLNKLNHYKEQILDNSSSEENCFSIFLITSQKNLLKIINDVHTHLKQPDPHISSMEILTGAKQAMACSEKALAEEKDAFFRYKLNFIKNAIVDHKYDLNSCFNVWLEGRQVSGSAKEVYDLLEDILHYDGLITHNAYARVAVLIHNLLDTKTEATNGFLFFKIGSRKQSTADLYQRILNYLELPIPARLEPPAKRNSV